jgi:dihydrofolate reductase
MGISIIVAMTRDRVIGEGGMIPWHIADDMRLFKTITTGGTVIMGRTTWLSLPEQFRPLPGRANIVVSTTLGDQPGAKVCKSVDEAIREARKNNNEIYCMGGGRLYAAMAPLADTMYISWVKSDYDGDTYFPEIDLKAWREEDTKEYPDFVFKKYSRIK